ncbi:MAG: TetR/AcrR family transcriptional regulator [bacterium]|nr:TetR/AcrR family transcriptional regulator [bacterium]
MAPQSNGVSTRERLVASARALFTIGSYGSIGVQELCEHADVRRGSFYYHFNSKRDLAVAALDAEWDMMCDQVFEPSFGQPTTAPLDAFAKFQDLLQTCYAKRTEELGVFGGCLLVSLPQELATIDEEIRNCAAAHMAKGAAYFEAALAQAIDTGELPVTDTKVAAQRILAYVEGSLALARAQADPDTLSRTRYELWRLAT